jgi:hypothetical protein
MFSMFEENNNKKMHRLIQVDDTIVKRKKCHILKYLAKVISQNLHLISI